MYNYLTIIRPKLEHASSAADQSGIALTDYIIQVAVLENTKYAEVWSEDVPQIYRNESYMTTSKNPFIKDKTNTEALPFVQKGD
jgi:hypothetical protein